METCVAGHGDLRFEKNVVLAINLLAVHSKSSWAHHIPCANDVTRQAIKTPPISHVAIHVLRRSLVRMKQALKFEWAPSVLSGLAKETPKVRVGPARISFG